MTEDEIREMNTLLCELFRDMLDSLTNSEKFAEMYYLKDISIDGYITKTLRNEHLYINNSYYGFIKSIEYLPDENFRLYIPIDDNNQTMVFLVNEREVSVEQHMEMANGSIYNYDGGLRMNDVDIDLVEETYEWCKSVNPTYW